MNKKNKGILFLAGFLLVVGLFAGIFFVATQSVLSTDIFCNDPEFQCCVEQKLSETTISLTETQYILCPSTANYCEIKSISKPYVYSGGVNCRYLSGAFTIDRWTCDDAVKITAPARIKAGNIVFIESGYASPITITKAIYDDKLLYCGDSGCNIGVAVSNANGCTFTSDKPVFTGTGKVAPLATSYTVPTDSCFLSFNRDKRHICGTKLDECNTDSDCGGRQYGNQVCSAKTLQTYGCVATSNAVPTEAQKLQDSINLMLQGKDSVNLNYGTVVTKKCQITEAKPVQCCGDDCGTGMFCDLTSFTCKAKPDCSVDSDCGVTQRCDFVTKQITKPTCTLGKCGWSKVSDVSCCFDTDCADSQTCTNNKCVEKQKTCTSCPFQCCDEECNVESGGSNVYTKKPCSAGQLCSQGSCVNKVECGNSVCEESEKIVGGANYCQKDCDAVLCVGWWSKITNEDCADEAGSAKALILGILFALGVGIFAYILLDGSKYGGKKKRAQNIALSVVVGLIVGFLIYWLVAYIQSKWYWILGIGTLALIVFFVLKKKL